MRILPVKYRARLLFVWLLVLLNISAAFAQHCPFDGAHLIVVQLVNSKDQPVTDAAENLRLREINQPNPSLCTFAEGILSKSMLAPLDALSTLHYYKLPELVGRFCLGCTFLTPGYYAVKLNMAEETCMIKAEVNGYDYRQREFEVQYASGITTQTVKIPKERVYSLCTAGGKWSRIVPVKLKLIK